MIKKSFFGFFMRCLAALCIPAACLLLGSCNVGLGESVDTESPTIKVTYPANSSTVRGKMVLYGICDDDKGVSNVTVEVTDNNNKNNKVDLTNKTAAISDGTWRLEIDTASLTDGNYTFTATAKDGAGHTTSSQGTYDIDNHAPLFIISKPGVTVASVTDQGTPRAASAYGSTLTVEGTIADSHSIPKMVLSVYDLNKNKIGDYEAGNISTAGGTSVTFANSYKDESEDNYYKIYSKGGEETQNFYATITLYDSAYEYNDPDGTNGGGYSGNSTSALYLYDDVYSTLLSSADGGLGLTAADLMNIMSGTSTQTEDIQNNVRSVLNEKLSDTAASEKYLKFSLNPNANPTYTVNNYDFDLESGDKKDIKQLSGGGSITVTYNYGLNHTNIQPYGDAAKGTPSLKVWMKKISATSVLPNTSEALTYLTDLQADVIKLEKDGATEFTEGETEAGEWLLIYDYAKHHEMGESSATDTFGPTIPSGKVESGAYYIFGVTGCDVDKMYFAQKTTFIFQGSVNGFAPTVRINEPDADNTYVNNAGMTFAGSAVLNSNDLYVREISAALHYGLTNEAAESYDLKYLVQKADDGTLAVKRITGATEEGYTTEDLAGTEPLSYYPSDVYETVTENGIPASKKIHSAGDFVFDVSKIDGYADLEKQISSSGKEYSYSIDITATSSSNHSASALRNVYVDTVKPAFDDDESSVGGKKTKAAVLETWFGSESLKVKGVLKEAGSGVTSVDYWLDKETSEESDGTFVPSYNSEDGTYVFSGAIAGFTEGKVHTLKFVGTDKAENKSTVHEYSIKTDLTSPSVSSKYYRMGTITGTAAGNVLTNKENNIVIYGLVSDTVSGLAAIEIPNAAVTYTLKATTVTSKDDSGKETTANVETNLDWFENAGYEKYESKNSTKYTGWKAEIAKDKIVAGDVNYTASDIAGNKASNRMFTFTVDQTKPEVEYKELIDADADADGIQVNGEVTLSGTANDNNQMEKITGIQYRIGDKGEWKKLENGVDSSSTAYSWKSIKINTAEMFPESKTNPMTVYFRAIALDAAGNYSDESDSGVKVSVDQNSDRPVIRISSLDGAASLDGAEAIISSTSVMGTVSDDDSVSKFEYSINAGADWNEITVSSGSWKIENLDAGTYSLTFRVTDKAGTIFTTGETKGTFATYNRPYLSYSDDVKTDNTSAVKFSVDLNPPKINMLKLAAASEKKAPSTADDSGKEKLSSDWKGSSESAVNLGKVNHYLYAYIKANEDVMVNDSAKDDITLKIGSSIVDVSSLVSRTPEGSTSGDLVYIIGPVDITSVSGAEGTQTVSVTVKDKSGRESSATQNIYIDEGAPEVSITSPNATAADAATGKTNGVSTTTEAITGKYTVKGRIADTSGIKTFKYMIPTEAQVASGINSSLDGWKSVNSLAGTAIDESGTKLSSSQWQIEFSSSSFESGSAEHGSSLIYYATAKTGDSLTYATAKDGSTTGEVYVPLYFYVEDATGNGEIVENKILVNPKGGIPTIEIITPDNLAKTGGNLNFQGTASDDENVSKVVLTKLQFSSYEATSDNYSTTSDTTFDWKDVSAEILKADGVVTKGKLVSTEDGLITADGTSSWKIAINTSKIPEPDLTAILGSGKELKTVRATIISYDENGTPSNYDVSTFAASAISSDSGENETSYVRRTIFVDKNAPKLVATQLVQFSSTPSIATEIPSVIRNYSAGIYISHSTGNGNWYLKGVVTDDASVTGIAITTGSNDYISLEGTVGSDSATAAPGSESGTSNGIIYSGLGTKIFTFLVPVDTSSEGQFYPTIEMWDGQHTDVTSNVSFFVDNDAPSLYTTSDTADASLAHADTLRLTSNGLQVNTANVVENSDGAYSFGDSVVEDKSGLDFIAVYFKKAANPAFNTKNRIYSPLFSSKNEVALTEVSTGSTAADGQVYINSEGLPALVKNVTRSAENKVSYSGLGSDGFVKLYTMVKIGGSYIRITGITGDEAALAEDVDKTITECEFIYAQIVDHSVAEGLPSSRGGEISNDDGDGFVETLKQTGSSYKWSASVYSDNIPDGPAEIHVVAFDNAGNHNAGYVKTGIANNRPRIAKVMLATDLDGNGKFDFYNKDSSLLNDLSKDNTVQNGSEFGEYVFYSTLKVSDSNAQGVAQSKITLNAPMVFNVKKDLLVLPEFVGGNGQLKYACSLDNKTSIDSFVTGSGNDLYPLASTLDSLKLADKAGTNQSAESLIQTGDNASNYGGVVLTMNSTTHNDLDDGDVRYLAFTFWDSTSETTQGTDSLWATVNIPAFIDVVDDTKPVSKIKPFWWNSKEDSSFVYDDDGNALGHIALESKSGDKPGVSGQIYINGTSYDETRLGEIHVVKPEGTIGGDGDVKIIYKDSSNNWTAADGAEILSEEEPSQNGHTITWRYKIDMTSYGVATDKVVKTYAVDAQSNKEDVSDSENSTEKSTYSGTDNGTKWTPVYKMDFVPYIKSIYTTSIGSANRSRLGKFPVRAGEEMTIEGMNFADGKTATVNFYKSGSIAGTVGEKKETETGTVSDGTVIVTAPQYSRWVEVVIDGVSTPNNDVTAVASIPGCDIEEGYVATAKDDDKGQSRANAAGTNFWTNNRYIDVWKVGTTFEGSINPHSGVVKKIRNTDTISTGENPTYSGNVGIKGTSSMMENKTGMTDHFMGLISSDDMRLYLYDNKNKNKTLGSDEVSSFTAPVDVVDMVVLGGLPYYVLQTNYVGNTNANCWGPGLILSRDGFTYTKSTYEQTTGLSESTYQWIIERQGDTIEATKRDSSTGFDSILYQFKNPRIAGWHTNNPIDSDKTVYSNEGGNKKREQLDYVYVSYYDSYAKCLKFATFRSGRDVGSDDGRVTTPAKAEWGGGNTGDHELIAEIRSANGNMTTGGTVVAGNDTTKNNPTSFTEKAGEWSDIVVDTTATSTDGPIPVIVYYNETNKCLEVARGKSKFPKSKNYVDKTTTTSAADTSLSGADAWHKSRPIRPKGSSADFGRYVSAAIDSLGNLHVAAQDATHSTLYYLYLKKDGNDYSVEKSVLLDAASGAGLWTDIELTNPSGSTLAGIKPVVSYINSSYTGTTQGIKIAYVSGGTGSNIEFDAATDPAVWSAGNQRTSVMADVYEGSGSEKAKIGVGFNSDMLALDFLRGEN